MYYGNANEGRARELHMVRKEKRINEKMKAIRTRASNLQIYSRPFGSWSVVVGVVYSCKLLVQPTPTCTKAGPHHLHLALVVFSFHQLVQILHLHVVMITQCNLHWLYILCTFRTCQ